MQMPEKTKNGCIRIVVENAMTVYQAEKLRKQWTAYFDDLVNADSDTVAEGVAFDLKKVRSCDITGVQLLCSARKTAEFLHKKFSVSEASAAVIEAVMEAGLEPEALFSAA